MMISRRVLVASSVLLALAWRLFLIPRYWGWEESDYGNLMMTRGVLDSGFRDYDMNHLPMFYGLSALLMAVVGDSVIATYTLSLISGVITVGLGTWLADRMVGRWMAGGVAVLLVFEPELALYSASALREPVYAAAVLGGLVALFQDRLALASALVGVAFLTRMDALLALAPALALHALGAPGRLGRLLRALGPLALAAFLWSWYCSVAHGTWAFWGHSVAVNIETGGAEHPRGIPWVIDGLGVSGALLAQVLPSRIGWLPWVGIFLGLLGVPWWRHDARRTLAVGALGLLGFWLGVGFVAQHEPGHNLYWKWLYAVLPPLLVVSAMGIDRLRSRLQPVMGSAGAWAFMAAGLGQALVAMAAETQRQLELSEQLYRPQVELALTIEAEAEPNQSMLVDNIPGCYIDRRANGYTLHTWMDVPITPGDPDAFARWVKQERIRYVVWFQEEWTQAPVVAPWLADPSTHVIDDLRFEFRSEDPAYGWIFYEVKSTAGALNADHRQHQEQTDRAVDAQPQGAE